MTRDAVGPRKMPEAERVRRLRALKASLPGLLIEAPPDPALVLLGRACMMDRVNEIKYLALQTRLSPTLEVTVPLDDVKLVAKGLTDVPEYPAQSALQLQGALFHKAWPWRVRSC